MFFSLSQRVAKLVAQCDAALLKNTLHGIEKESLRIDKSGLLSQKPHPKALGSAFTHDEITTDFSESLLEFITPPTTSLEAAADELLRIHQFTIRNLDDEWLWPCSMPCVLSQEEEIPLANYGQTNLGRMKTLYRKGIGMRYGRAMQAIAGVHYNFSFDDTLLKQVAQNLHDITSTDPVSDLYFGLMRNYHRSSWLVPYLFGASPVVCGSFFAHEAERFPIPDRSHYANPYAVALRLSDIGYKNRTNDKLHISYDSPSAYVASLKKALLTDDPVFASLGVKQGEEWLQLNSHILQIEAEHYGSIRPKRIPRPLERPLHALAERGVQYVEIRTLDLYPFSPIGVDNRVFRFLDVLMLACLITESPSIGPEEQKILDENLRKVVNEGRKPGLMLTHQNQEWPLAELGLMFIQNLRQCATLLDKVFNRNCFTESVDMAEERFKQTEKLPSSQLLEKVKAAGGSFFKAGLHLAEAHSELLKRMPFSPEAEQKMVHQAEESLRRHEALSQMPEPPFDEFMAYYFNPERL